MNKPCNIECGNEPDWDCETCGYRNVEYPMPGAVKSSRNNFESKYGLEGQGMPLIISQETILLGKMLNKQCDSIIEGGKIYGMLENRRFG